MGKQAIILCSGGLDSVITAFHVKKNLEYDKIKILFFNYGQRNLKGELEAVNYFSNILNVELQIFDSTWLNSHSTSLLNSTKKPEEIKDLKDTKGESDKFYVPCRNTLFITNAMAIAEATNKDTDIFLGFKCEGQESYPDTTKEFIEEINRLAEISCNNNIRILAPLIEKDKEDIVNLAQFLDIQTEKTFSCYIGPKVHCGTCLACKLRQQGFYWANIKDLTKYTKN